MKRSIAQPGNSIGAWRVMAIAIFFVVLAGCNVGPKYHPPTATAPAVFKESPSQFAESDGWTVAQPKDATLRGK